MRDHHVLKLIVNDVIKVNPTINSFRGDLGEIKSKMDRHDHLLGAIQSDVRSLRGEVVLLHQTDSALKQDVTTLKQDVATLKQNVATLKQNVADLRSEMRQQFTYFGVIMEDIKHKMNLILDGLLPARERATEVEQVFTKVDDHEYRITAVESVIKEQNF